MIEQRVVDGQRLAVGRRRRSRRARIAAVAVFATGIVVSGPVAAPVGAAGSPDIVVTKTAPNEALIGSTPSITLRACNPTGQPDGFNLSFRDVIPVGLSYVAGSGSPAPSRIIAGQPAAGQTTLIWENVSDLLTGACTTISYQVDTNPDSDLATTAVGTTVGTAGGAYVNSNAFAIPDFDPVTGQPTGDFTGSDTDGPTATTITAFVTEKDPGNNGEGELTRGVHGSNPKTYTLRIRNNPETPTIGFDVVDVLPPTLEFLGCVDYTAAGYDAGTDNTIDAPTNQDAGAQTDEYPGSGRMAIGATAATCIQPTTIETLAGGSTRVTWSAATLGSAANLAAGAELEITYLAGVPMRANTDTWPGGKPTDASLGQGRNLDNNSGAATSETATEQSVTNTVSASGTYQGPSTSVPNPRITDTADATVSAEDLLIRKSSSGQVIQGTVVTHLLTIETGEYRDATNLRVTDTLPDGMCPLSTPAIDLDADCGTGAVPQISVNGGAAVAAPYTSATENADGTWTLVWDQTTIAGLASLPHDGTITIAFASRVRRFYQQNEAAEAGRPVLVFDSMTNDVAVEAPDFRRATIDPVTADPELDGQLDLDVSSATVDSPGPEIDKRVSQKSGALVDGAGLSASTIGDVCRDGVGITWRDGIPDDDGAVTGYGPGDYVCFDLRATFPAELDAAGVKITDLLPASYELVAGSARRVTAGPSPDTLAGTTFVEQTALSGSSDAVVFTVASAGGLVPSSPTGQTFHWTIAARLLDPALGVANDIDANLMKMTTQNSAGSVFVFRDQAAAVWTEPQVKLDKSNDAATPRPIGSTVDFSIKVWNDGNVTAIEAEVWDRLPTGISCTDVSLISPASGVCTSGVIRWPAAAVPTVAANTTLATAPVELTYRVTVPTTVDPGRTYTNTAGVRQYEAFTNANDSPFVYVPSNNIDTTVTPNTDPASDTSSFTTPAVTNAKVQQSGVADPPRNPANSPAGTANETATIGETITYTITATIPAGTTVTDARFSDALDADLVLDATPTWVFVGVANDPAWTLTAPTIGTNGTVRLDRAGTYTNAAGSGDDLLVVTIVARVSNAVGTTAGDTFPNTAAFSWLPDPAIGTTRVTVNSNQTTGTVREPAPSIVKDENDADDIVNPNQAITYTLTVNNTGANATRLHEAVVVDTIPAGVTVVNGVTPVADGGSVGPDGGTWNATARTITWNSTTTSAKLSSIAGGSSTSLSYAVVVDDPATSGSIFTNNVTVTGSSLQGTPTGERTTYTASTSDTVTAPLATVTKNVTPSTATIGDTVTYTVDATIPAGITAYDTTLLDTLPDGIDFRAYGTIAYTGTSTGCPDLGTTGATGIAGQTANADGSTTIGFFLGDITAPSGNSCVIRITYTARVDDTYVPEGTAVSTNQNLVNGARLYWNGTNSISVVPTTPPAPGGFGRSSSLATATVGVREPLVRIDKDVSQSGCDQTPGNTADADTCATDAGSSYTFTLTVTNDGNWPAYDVAVSDTPDSDLTNIVVPSSTGTVTVVDGTAPNLAWTIPGPIAANTSVTITYTADLAASSTLNDGEVITNTADVPTYFGASSTTRTADPSADWRTYGQGGAGGDVAADTVTMTVGFPNVTVVKSAISDATDARVGVPFTWRIRATNQLAEPTAPAYDVDLDDTLPAGWVYVAGSASITTPYGTVTGAGADPTCVPNCTAAGAVLTWNDVVSGSPQPLAPGAQVTIEFAATPQASLLTVGTTGTFDHVNTAGVDAEDVTGATGNADGSYGGPDDTEPARIRRTDLSVTKSVTAGPYSFGSEVNWTVTVSNAGPDTATNVTVADVLDPAELVFVQVVSATQGTYSSSTGTWTVGSIPSGTTHTLVIRTRLNKIGSITNRAWVRGNDQWDVDSTPSTNAPTTDEDDDDSVTITSVSTSLGDYVWYDVDGDSTADSGEPGIPGVRIVLESAGLDGIFGNADDFFGPDGVLGGGDDITVTETTTNATGFYGFSNLPTGQYRVRVDPTTLPAGMTPTFNDDAPSTADPDLDDRSGVITLNSSTGYLAADFGYTGTGSLGDTVWLDLNASGGATQQSGEPGIGDVDVTLVWGGFDGDLSTTTDNVTYPIDITDANGQYLFERLPAGPYRVTLDAADLPAGTAPTFDLDGTGTANAVTTSLTAGQNRVDVDFSVAGTGSIGDRVWYDADGDGTQDPGETGFGGVDVTVTWLGPDGVPGGGDDVVFTTTTASDGTYLVDHLPAGSYTVVLDATDLPAGVVPTFDLDGIGTPGAALTTLTPGQDRRDVDFGYRGVASVGDRVWFDRDGDGASAPESDDVGLAGITVTVRWAGPDGVFGTGDDVVRTTTTDATGTYLVGNLPYGPVRVTVDPAQLPGMAATFDGDGTGTANQVTVVLAADDAGTPGVDEANPRTADFAYTGTGSIGDLIWIDADADGVADSGEQGLPNVGVTVTWGGPDGVVGTADDVSFPTTTGPDGTYLVDRLPAGTFTVVVDTSTVPAGLVNVFDPDAATDSRTTVTLTPGQDRTDVDFGYRLQADLSITKTHAGNFEVGREGRYTIVVRNLGPAAAVTPTVTDTLPTGLSYLNATGVGASCSANGQTVTCTLATMALDATVTITLAVAVGRAAAPGVTNTVTVSSPTFDPVPGNNTASDPTSVPLADLSVTKQLGGTLVNGTIVTYTIVATNLGPSPSGGPVTIVDDLPAGLVFVEAGGAGVTCGAVGQTVTCVTTGPLAVGQSVSVSVRVRVNAAPGQTIVNSARVEGPQVDSLPAVTDPVPTNNDSAVPGTVTRPTLPSTGALVGRWIAAALWAILLGVVLVLGARRRRTVARRA